MHYTRIVLCLFCNNLCTSTPIYFRKFRHSGKQIDLLLTFPAWCVCGSLHNSYGFVWGAYFLRCTVRVMDYLQFANSKTFFRSERHHFFPGHTATMQPLMVHMNYHPDKHDRMLCIMARYFQGQLDACDKLPGGSEKGTWTVLSDFLVLELASL